MRDKKYRVIQWATGSIGRISIRHFVDNPVFELVGAFVTNPQKVGKDAGEIAGTRQTGVIATNDIDAILALDADCVHYAPFVPDLDVLCRILRSGKNVVSPACYVYPTDYYRKDLEKVEAACRNGGSSFHGSGIHPGFSGDLLPLNLVRLMSRVDHIHVHEIADFRNERSNWPKAMGFGRAPDDLLANPSRSPEAIQGFIASMAMVIERLGKKIEKVTARQEVARAKCDIEAAFGVVRAGTVAGLHFEWTAWVDGQPFMTFHAYWTMGGDTEPNWDFGSNKYRVVIEGDPPLQITLEASRKHPDEELGNSGLVWTAMNCVNVIPDVCDAPPGLITHLDLGVAKPRGLVRPRSADFNQPVGL